MKYYSIELHAHTHHSDGDFSVTELIQAAKKEPYDILTITDHNTLTPYHEWHDSKQENTREDFDEELLVVPGIEWTTFFGHMLVIGANEVIDWREAKIKTLDRQLKQIKKAQGIVGIAHPFSVGSPLCTGCHWDFEIEDFSLVDFIEVWNRCCPDENYRSQQAYEWWIELLLQGYRIACSAGRDWHRMEQARENTALSYIGLEQPTISGVYQSLRQGNFYISLGPTMTLRIDQAGQRYYMGSELLAENAVVVVKVAQTKQPRLQAFHFLPQKIRFIQNEQIIFEAALIEDQLIQQELKLEPGYFRVEVLGTSKGQAEQRLVISNPFYIR